MPVPLSSGSELGAAVLSYPAQDLRPGPIVTFEVRPAQTSFGVVAKTRMMFCRKVTALTKPHSPATRSMLIGDPIDDLSSGRTPSVFGTLTTLDEVIRFQTFEDYPDPSTPTDLCGLIEAWTAAGFDGGVAAKRQNGNNLVMATVVKFASPESARSAVAAHIRDLCHRSVQSSRHDDGAGMTVLRDSGSVRSIRAIGRYEISLYACSCIAVDDADRLDALSDWQDAVDGVWSAPDPDQDSGPNRL